MNVENLRENYPKLLSFMKSAGYSEDYVNQIRRAITHILKKAGSKEWSSYGDIYLEYEKTSRSPSYLRARRTIIGVIEQFDIYGRYPDGRHRHELWERGAYPHMH